MSLPYVYVPELGGVVCAGPGGIMLSTGGNVYGGSTVCCPDGRRYAVINVPTSEYVVRHDAFRASSPPRSSYTRPVYGSTALTHSNRSGSYTSSSDWERELGIDDSASSSLITNFNDHSGYEEGTKFDKTLTVRHRIHHPDGRVDARTRTTKVSADNPYFIDGQQKTRETRDHYVRGMDTGTGKEVTIASKTRVVAKSRGPTHCGGSQIYYYDDRVEFLNKTTYTGPNYEVFITCAGVVYARKADGSVVAL